MEVVALAAAGERSCVLTARGSVRCWGANTNGELGYHPSTLPDCIDPAQCNVAVPSEDVDLGGRRMVELALGPRHACARDEDGAVYCWGSQIWGRLGDGQSQAMTAAVLATPAVIIAGHPVDLGDGDGDGLPDRAVQLSMGDEHSCARMHTGGLRCWGHGTAGRLGYASSDTVGDFETPAVYYAGIGLADLPVF